ncbi:tRNA-dependent cyclodipeptide synthase [Amycolatopsis sp. NPDC059021]|uniref:tRNA-dependent cyclodipeptide synthase n=1 Tax=Amycolatopsis sp. NPDC059021 TaxID=3346704 RepID=UPI00366EF843
MLETAESVHDRGLFTIETVTARCRRVVDRAEHALVALSPFNSYYKPSLVRDLVAWCYAHFDTVDVFTPGYEAVYTLTAAGTPPREAVRRARQALNTLRTAAVKGLIAAGDSKPHSRVHTWTTLAARRPYRLSRERTKRAYAEDPVVRTACREIARLAVRTNTGTDPADSQLDVAVHYPLAELPLIIDSPAIFGVRSSVFLYHREMGPFMPLVFGESRSVSLSPGQAFGIARRDG